ncbi:hypothetical protein P8452_47844 [Trifolium repens]|nr:hypothetical protein P8452_47844 [Trifolium repens]
MLSSQSYSSLSKSYSLPTLFGTNENSDSYLGSGHIITIGSNKKGMPWTEEEHNIFLRGLEKLGKDFSLSKKSLIRECNDTVPVLKLQGNSGVCGRLAKASMQL